MHNNQARQAATGAGGNAALGGINQKQLQDLATNQFNKTMQIDEEDKQAWALIHKVPSVNKYVGIAVFVFNLVLPGFGTGIAACAAEGPVSKLQLAIGLFQFLTTYILVGWIWSIYWGWLIVSKAWGPVRGQANAARQPQAAPGGAAGQYDNVQYNNNRQAYAIQQNPNPNLGGAGGFDGFS